MDDGQLGIRANRWRESRGYSTEPGMVGFKLLEEAGEVAKAVIGQLEGREGRGDPLQEAAQTIIVLAALIHLVDPGADLYGAVENEMAANGALGPLRFIVNPGAGDPVEPVTECQACGQTVMGDDETDMFNRWVALGQLLERRLPALNFVVNGAETVRPREYMDRLYSAIEDIDIDMRASNLRIPEMLERHRPR